ncbi:50S ribosomal protein L1 [candidate division FCPU426 bacterium]|nr:50S ribosomal protein L1 [candidate division FCPU426 bacterium]
MRKESKRHSANQKLVDRSKRYTVAEAVSILDSAAKPKFDETVDVSIRLGVNPKKADQQVRGTMVLPHGVGKSKRICVIAKGEQIQEAQNAGADFAGYEDIIERIQGGWMDFDVVIATPDVMRDVGKLGKILGTKGLMPNPKAGTVSQNIGQAIKEVKAGRIEYRVNNEGLVNMGVGRISFGQEKVMENVKFAVETILRARPAGAKGQYMKAVSISTTMGPGLKLDLSQFAGK